jgi:hypothetical protein
VREFLEEYWAWIAIPFVAVLLIVLALWYFAGRDSNDLIYPILGG